MLKIKQKIYSYTTKALISLTTNLLNGWISGDMELERFDADFVKDSCARKARAWSLLGGWYFCSVEYCFLKVMLKEESVLA